MKNILFLGLAVALTAAAQQGGRPAHATSNPQGSKTASPASPATTNELPANAEKVRENMWRVKDPAGKVWIYTRTPFGFSRAAEGAPEPNAKAGAQPELKVASIEGENIRFERETPFGKSKWTKRISELNDDERAVYEKSSSRQSEKQ